MRLRCRLRFTLDKTEPRAFDEFIEAAREVPEVTGIETFLGRVDVRLNVIARDMRHWTDDLPRPHPGPAAYRRGRGADAGFDHQGCRGVAAVIDLDDIDRSLLRALVTGCHAVGR